jgi:hypothetical protein
MLATAQHASQLASARVSRTYRPLEQSPALESSLTFRTMLEAFPDPQCLRILDLGDARQEPLDFFCNNHACQYRFYPLLDAAGTTDGFADFPNQVFDIILGWNRLSYLRDDLLRLATQRLSAIGNRSTLLFVSMKGRVQSVSRVQTNAPQQDAEESLPAVLEQHNQLGGLRQLMEYFPHAESVRSVLLQNGTQEIILRLS